MDMKRFFLYCMTGAVLALASGCNGSGGGGGGVAAPPTTMPMTPPPTTPTTPTPPPTTPTTPTPPPTTPTTPTPPPTPPTDDAAQRETNALIRASKTGDFPYPVRSRQVGAPSWRNSPYRALVTHDNWDADYPPTGIALGRESDLRSLPFTGGQVITRKQSFNPQGDTLGKDDGHLANESEFLKKERDLPPLGQFTGEVHKRTVKDGTVTTTDEIMLYHDKKEPGLVPYSVYYGAVSRYYWRWDSSGRGVGGYRAGNPNIQSDPFAGHNQKFGVSGVTWGTNTSGPAPENGVLTLKNAPSKNETALFMSPSFPTIPNQEFTYFANPTGNQRPRSFSGTFKGGSPIFNEDGSVTNVVDIPGTYACTAGASCTIGLTSTGDLRFTGTWKFTPTAPAYEIMLPVDHDSDYLAFGYWEQTKTGQAPVIRTIVAGSDPFGPETQNSGLYVRNGAMGALRGKATYKGRAIGRYGHHTVDENGSMTPGSQSTGLFTAKTTLTAQFGDNTNEVALNDQFAITGTVTDFKPFDPTTRQDLLSAWTVELQKARFADGLARPDPVDREYTNTFPYSRVSDPARRQRAPTRGMTGTTPGPTPGDWVGRFFGPDGAHPTGVTGAFDANFTNGNVRGAFGATRE